MTYKTSKQISRLIISFLCLMFCSMGSLADQAASQVKEQLALLPVPQYENWRLVADSDLVVIGQLSVPLETIRKSLRTKKYDYVTISLKPQSNLKGAKIEQTIKVRFYTQPVPYSPSPEQILQLDGKKVVAFLSVAGDVDNEDRFTGSGIYFAGYTPLALQRYNSETFGKVSQEVENQQRIADGFSKSQAGVPDKFQDRVAVLIERALDRQTQAQAFDEIVRMGPAAVPSIIRLMDDQRPLPLQQMSVATRNPDAFEATAHYSPKVMVDALSILLGQLTEESFGQISNGGSEQQRTRTIRAWRVYLFYKTMSSEAR